MIALSHTSRAWAFALTGLVALALPVAAQPALPQSSLAAERVGPVVERAPAVINGAASASAPLMLRGGAVATGLHGYYDYQSNGGSPEYIEVHPGAWSNIYTTFMNSLSGASSADISNSRRAGYAVSTDGGVTWSATTSIADTKLGYPDIEASAEPVVYIAAHGDFGGGANQVAVYANPTPPQAAAFIPLGTMPISTASGRADRGVIWTSFELNADGTRGYLAATYFSDASNVASPLQVGSIDLTTGTAPERWSEIPDSVHSTTSGGRYVLARSAGGKLGIAWFRYALFSGDTEYGIYYSESTDNGTSWSEPQGILTGELVVSGLDINGDPDTLSAGANIDGTYIGEDLHLTFTGNMNGLLRYGTILHWSPAKGLQLITLAHQVPGLGAYGLDTTLRQANMGTLSYPTLTASEDGQKIVVVYSAVSQTFNDETQELESVANENGFLYYRLWAVGSTDGGTSWSYPFIVQDFAGEGTDSASIEYPALAPLSRMVGSDLELNLTFQARRQPGGFAFTNPGQIPGAVEDIGQYYQRFMVTPELFATSASVSSELASSAGMSIASLAPNPAHDHATITYTIARAGNVSMRVYDELGRLLATPLASQRREPGLHSQTIGLQGLGAGVYRIVLDEGGATTSTQLVVR